MRLHEPQPLVDTPGNLGEELRAVLLASTVRSARAVRFLDVAFLAMATFVTFFFDFFACCRVVRFN